MSKYLDSNITIVYNITMKSIMVRRIPDNIHHDFKIACAKKDISMNECLIELMKKYIEENNGK
jgi:predicted HicB family RNase H-like nuclease